MWDIDAGARVSETLAMLRDEVSRLLLRRVPSESPAIRLPAPPPPPLPSGPLTPASLCAVVAATQPEGTILVDESLTSGGRTGTSPRGVLDSPTSRSRAAPSGSARPRPSAPPWRRRETRHQPPSRRKRSVRPAGAVDASARTPRRRHGGVRQRDVRHTETRARDATRRGPGGRASRRLRANIADPAIRWVELAEGFGVPARTVDSAEAFAEAMREALSRSGPSLIEAKLA